MLLADVLHIPTAAALGFIGSVLLTATILSLLIKHRHADAQPVLEPEHHSETVSNPR
jgi:hypothetical protein